ncbi:hypothetical protein [Stenotrophomonas sp. YAU14D1_LEIMI4_1]|uniref:hypothetical protein n=1 Tax=Stenotrophomonas sp. YAU14D1_LEIMI4_1 TaxID=2072407 RepID=UPI000F714C94|nr:hypothetical protein [Stenotrophomonas sp. YAU14D1_LEIMI4_1]AWH25423.1 hypothetical protein C1932_10150 [Stenotrophomonas sp. YAU14D1_LEIMI4_1]
MPIGYALILIFPVLAAVFRIWASASLDGSARISARDCAVDQFKGGALFLAVGPLVGTLAAFLAVSLKAGTVLNPLAMLFLLLFAYPMGAIPAMATGALMGALKPWLWGWRALALSSATGALLSSIPSLAAGSSRGLGDAAAFCFCAWGGAVGSAGRFGGGGLVAAGAAPECDASSGTGADCGCHGGACAFGGAPSKGGGYGGGLIAIGGPVEQARLYCAVAGPFGIG